MKAAATSLSASARSEGRDLSASAPHHARIPILYVILGVLLVISIVPMYFYSAQVEAINRERLKTNEKLLQNTVTRSLADDLAQHERSLRMMLANLSSAIQVASGGDIGETNIQSPELRALLENFASSDEEIAYATLLNSDAKGIFRRTHRSRCLSESRTGACLCRRPRWPRIQRASPGRRRGQTPPAPSFWSVIP